MTPGDLIRLPLATLGSIDVTAAAFKAHPFPFYARLRAEQPVFQVTVRGKQRAWLVTRYDDVLRVLKDDATFVKDPRRAMSAEQLARAPRIPSVFKVLERNLLSMDGADHNRLKALVHQGFTPRMVERMREKTVEVTRMTLDRALAKRSFDLIADVALPVPLTIIGRILGVPESDHAKFKKWMKAFVAIGSSRNPLFLIPSILRFIRYLRQCVRARRARPEDDLISALARAHDADDRLSEDEVLAMVFLLLSAGHETTVNLIASGMLALMEHPDERARLIAEPSLMPLAVEELVRFVVPADMATERYAAQDVEIAGTRIDKGEMVIGVIASANRDASHFENPDVLDVGRQKNRHLSFGQGLHYCLGAPLSRMEASIAIGEILERAPELRIAANAKLKWRRGLIVRGLVSLPVTRS